MQTREQKYAADAYSRAKAIKKEDRASYGSMAHSLPILIRRAGLAQALSFVESRGNATQHQLLSDLQATVGCTEPLPQAARNANLPEYILLTRQVMDALLWYKRFAQSVLDIHAGDTKSEENR